MNVLRSTENILFYWEVSNGSGRTPLKRPWLQVKLQKCCSLCPLVQVGVRLIQKGIPPAFQVVVWTALEDPAWGPVTVSLCVMSWRPEESEDLYSPPVYSFNKYLLITCYVHTTLHQAIKGGRLVGEGGIPSHRREWWGWGRARREDGHTGAVKLPYAHV